MRDECIDYVYSAKRLETRDRGMTNNLRKRVGRHKNSIRGGFTDDYNCIRLRYWKSFDDVHSAIGREKQLKLWRPRKEDGVDRTQEPAPARLGG